MKKFLLLFLPLVLFAQTTNPDRDSMFSTAKTTTLAAAAEVLTVQHTTSSHKSDVFKSAYGFCSVACTITLERGGTTASSTTNTIVNVNPNNTNAQTSESSAFNTSNVGVGTVVNVYQLSAGAYVSIDLTNVILENGVADNITLRTSSITGTVQLEFLWVER